MTSPNDAPWIAGGFGIVLLILSVALNQYFARRTQRENAALVAEAKALVDQQVAEAKTRVDSAEIAKAKIDDGTKIRGELWRRVELLETEIRVNRDEAAKEIHRLQSELDITKAALATHVAMSQALTVELADAKREIKELVLQLQVLRNREK